MQVLAFGDSFVKMFLHCRPAVRFVKFKGKSIKGLVKDTDEEHERVQKQIARSPKVKHILFIFGQVDFNYVRYYKLINDEPQITQEVFRDYIKWVSGLNKKKNISIVSIFPSPVRQEHIINSLISKASYQLQKQTPQNDKKILKQYHKSKQVWHLWNSWIYKYCQIYKINNIQLFEEYEIPEEFIDLSNLNIHLRYVPVLKRISKHIDIKFDLKKAERIERQYEEDKVNRIQQSMTRMALAREQNSETTAEQEQFKNSSSLNNNSSNSESGEIQNNSLKKIQSHKGSSDFDDLKKEDIDKPARKKTVEIVSIEAQEKNQKKQKSEKAVQKRKEESDEQSEDDDAFGQQFLQMAMGGKNKY